MRVIQGRVSKSLVFNGFLEKYGLEPYTRIREPLVQYGAYPRDLDVLRTATGPVIVIWAGTDLTLTAGKSLFKDPKFHHVACSSMAEKDLTDAGLKYRRVNVLPVDTSDIKPAPLGKKIYAYAPRLRWTFYGGHHLEKLKKLGYPLVVADSHTKFSREELLEVYRDSYIGLRLTGHDSLSVTVCELGLMGRMCVYNEDTPNAIPWKNLNDIIAVLDRDWLPDPEKVASGMREFLDCGTDWLDLSTWS